MGAQSFYNVTAYEDDRVHVDTMYTSSIGSNIARTSALLSTISSILIIVMISRSSASLSITYHRLMFGMSVCDMLASIAMALTTLPMPADMIYTQFEGRHIGTFGSCAAQSYAQNGGTLGTLFYNVALSIHYFYSVRTDKMKMRRSVETILHMCSMLVPIGIVICFSRAGTTNPTPYLPWCGAFVGYPYWCINDDNTECLRGHHAGLKRFISVPIVGSLIITVFILMVLIVWRVHENEKLVRMYDGIYRFNMNARDEIQLERSQNNSSLSKAILIQAASYVLALVLSQSSIFLRVLAAGTLERSNALQIYHLITRPLQGFFNLIVFVGDKVYSYRRGRPEVSIFNACIHILTKSHDSAFVFSHMSILQMHQQGAAGDGDSGSNNVMENVGALIDFPMKLARTPPEDQSFSLSGSNVASHFNEDTLSVQYQPSSDPSIVVSDATKFADMEGRNGTCSSKKYYTNIRSQINLETEQWDEGTKDSNLDVSDNVDLATL